MPAILLALGLGSGLGFASAIAPTGPAVPANLLRFEVYFDRPMPGLSPQAIVLRDGSGKPVDDALLDIALPAGNERSLVVLMQPGRVKHGIGPNLALGPVLHEGERISLEVNDARLARPLLRCWRVAAPATGRLVPALWAMSVPAARGRAALVLELPSAINASAVGLLAIAAEDGRRIAGVARLDQGERAWRFVPAAPWQRGSYQLRIHPALEDPAGNRLCAAFEERLQSRRACSEGASVGFRIAAP